ncbi:sugar phosphate nucleotidyltransferase [Gorillibacterium sp. CAU 1737]|uniref:sugar phosphate nucleotidyltransferase n=1 Tax=Gorillibacterium sp. CAU 1737 TaxID=3140362 RepID=UPI003260B034
MRVVLLSGGSGKRLWPLSNEIRSKAFLRLLVADEIEVSRESMIQRICRQLKAAKLLDETLILTHESQVEITRAHVGEDISVLSEPFKRGTFTAIALAAAYYHSRLQLSLDEVICVLPVDSYVEDGFFDHILAAPAALAESGAQLVLIGTKPTFPSSQYGYILPEKSESETHELEVENEAASRQRQAVPVSSFAEKPSPKRAEELIAQGALWNCGVFAFSLGFLLSCLKERGVPTDYDALLAVYPELPEASFDYEVVERAAPIAVLPYSHAWEDLGSWATFAPHLGHKVVGAGGITEDCRNTHIVNETAIPIQVIGLSDVIVAASADGILVSAKEEASRIKSLLSNASDGIRSEEKRWGGRTSLNLLPPLDRSLSSATPEPLLHQIWMKSGGGSEVHLHQDRDELFIVLTGKGELLRGEEVLPLIPGAAFPIPHGTPHRIQAHSALTGIEVHFEVSRSEERP